MENSEQTELESTETETEQSETSRPGDVKPKNAMEHWLKRQFPFSLRGMLAALELAETPIPYIAFYQKDLTDGLKSDDLYRLSESKAEWEEIVRRQQHLLQDITAQGKMTNELKLQIERSTDLDRLEDIYAPFKLKRQTLGMHAKEAGLGSLADYLWNKAHDIETAELPGESLEEKAAPFAKPDSKYPDVAAVLKGVQDILVEKIAESFELRSLVRSTVFRRSKVKSTKGSKAKPNSRYSKFFDYQEPIGSLKKSNASHRYLAMRKGWMEDELILSFERPDEGILLEKFEEYACPKKESLGAEILTQAARLALKGNVYTVMENEAHRHLKEEAERHVMDVLGENLRKKLLRPGIGRKAVMGVDPGAANHPCSLALVDRDGKFLLNLPFKFEEITDSVKQEFLLSLENLKIEAIAVAHGPKSKEVRDGFRKVLEEAGKNIPIVSIHEHSANIYSSSPAAKEEFPALDVNSRRAVFVARYLQDPLSVVMRMDPKFLSLGEFQHDVNQNRLRQMLTRTVEACVNFVGVDPNHSPLHMLTRVAGLHQDLAKAIIQTREEAPFQTREDLLKVPGLKNVYDYCAGFLKMEQSSVPFDRTFIHPKHYAAVQEFASTLGVDPFQMSQEQLDQLEKDSTLAEKVGASNLHNIRYELSHLGEDPRGRFEAFEYDPSLKSLADLKKDTSYSGVITNVTSFGAFVDVGIEQDGLVHISELSDSKNPFDTVFPGDFVTVWVTGVNEEKKQISLTMKNPAAKGPRSADRRPRGPRPQRAPRPKKDAPIFVPPEGPISIVDPTLKERAEQRVARFREKESQREEKRPAKKPTRDPKTGAIVKLDDVHKRERGGPRVDTKAKPVTFNPFANLAHMLKDKQEK